MGTIIKNHEFLDWADRYLRNELSRVESLEFEQFCKDNPSYQETFNKHTSFIQNLKTTENRSHFKKHLEKEAQFYHSNRATEKKTRNKNKVFLLWDRFKINIAAAAAVAIISVFGTLWITGFYSTIKKTTSDYSALRRDINNVKRNVNAQNVAINNINREKKEQNQNIQYGATGFLLSADGYVVTNNHVILGADSILLQNSKGDSFKANIIHTDVNKDIAVLHIEDDNFRPAKNVPYTFKSQDTELGEDIYTIGFPRDEAVYGQGYLSSSTGYEGDTIAYQISIPVNPGNSGGPVLDSRGNIIGIISGKQTGIDGAAFAIKSKALLEAISEIPQDSLSNNININHKNNLAHLPRTEQIKRLQDYIYIVKVY